MSYANPFPEMKQGRAKAGAESLTLSVVVPVYNSSMSLPRLVKELHTVLPTCSSSFELILVNDASTDRSWQVIVELAREHTWVHGINLMRNVGQHNALLCGIRTAKHEIVATIDDDLQNPPGEIPKLLAKLEEGFDVVYGTPERERHGILRDLASIITKMVLQNAMGAEIARDISAFRVFRTAVRQAFAKYHGPFVSIDVLLTWGTTRFAAIRVCHEPRREGASGYSLRKLIAHAFNMMTGFSVLPLQLASLIGFVFTAFGLLALAFVIGRYLIQGSAVPGFAFLASIIAIFSGAQLFALGIIGEYLARVHFRIMDRPPYTVRSVAPGD
jgi:undecaprenyl-phosphate 4-deoxy-4-formamido-L-arabinose transferase